MSRSTFRRYACQRSWRSNPKSSHDRRAPPATKEPHLSSAMLPVFLADEIVDAGLSSLPRIERANTLVYFRAQCAQLFDMQEQCPPDLFLILGGKAFYFR